MINKKGCTCKNPKGRNSRSPSRSKSRSRSRSKSGSRTRFKSPKLKVSKKPKVKNTWLNLPANVKFEWNKFYKTKLQTRVVRGCACNSNTGPQYESEDDLPRKLSAGGETPISRPTTSLSEISYTTRSSGSGKSCENQAWFRQYQQDNRDPILPLQVTKVYRAEHKPKKKVKVKTKDQEFPKEKSESKGCLRRRPPTPEEKQSKEELKQLKTQLKSVKKVIKRSKTPEDKAMGKECKQRIKQDIKQNKICRKELKRQIKLDRKASKRSAKLNKKSSRDSTKVNKKASKESSKREQGKQGKQVKQGSRSSLSKSDRKTSEESIKSDKKANKESIKSDKKASKDSMKSDKRSSKESMKSDKNTSKESLNLEKRTSKESMKSDKDMTRIERKGHKRSRRKLQPKKQRILNSRRMKAFFATGCVKSCDCPAGCKCLCSKYSFFEASGSETGETGSCRPDSCRWKNRNVQQQRRMGAGSGGDTSISTHKTTSFESMASESVSESIPSLPSAKSSKSSNKESEGSSESIPLINGVSCQTSIKGSNYDLLQKQLEDLQKKISQMKDTCNCKTHTVESLVVKTDELNLCDGRHAPDKVLFDEQLIQSIIKMGQNHTTKPSQLPPTPNNSMIRYPRIVTRIISDSTSVDEKTQTAVRIEAGPSLEQVGVKTRSSIIHQDGLQRRYLLAGDDTLKKSKLKISNTLLHAHGSRN